MAQVTVTKGYSIPFGQFTAYPFVVGSQTPKTGTRALAYDDLLAHPELILKVVVLPIIAVMLAFKGAN